MLGTSEPTTEHLAELGAVALHSAALDYGVEVMLWGLIGSGQEIGASLTIGQPFSWRIDRLRVLARARLGDEQLVEDVLSFAERASAANKRRNQMLHSVWTEGEEGEGFNRIKFRLTRGRPALDMELMSIKDLQRVGLDLRNCFAEVTQLLARLPEELIDGVAREPP